MSSRARAARASTVPEIDPGREAYLAEGDDPWGSVHDPLAAQAEPELAALRAADEGHPFVDVVADHKADQPLELLHLKNPPGPSLTEHPPPW
jgi:hypothetical protein